MTCRNISPSPVGLTPRWLHARTGFPAAGIQIDATINDDRTWESTNVEFPTVTTSGIEAQVSAVDGIEGEIDRENNVMTAEGTLNVALALTGDSFEFEFSGQ